MDIDREKIEQQLEFLKTEIDHLNSKKRITRDEYIRDKEIQYFVERCFQKAIEACINIGNHIISRKHLGNPGNFSEIFKLLGRSGIIPLELSERFIYIARFRNKLVHLYWEIDPEEIYKFLQNNISDFEEFYRIILPLL